MSDGAVVFDTRLNNKQLEKDYAKTVRKIEDLESEIDIKTAKKSGLVKQADAMVGALDEAKAKLYEMQTAGKGVFAAEDIQSQKENVAQLQSQWDGIQRKIDQYDKNINNATDKMDAQKNKAARISQEIDKAAKSQNKFSVATEAAETRMEKLGTRILAVAKRALGFAVLYRGLSELKKWFGEVIEKNDQTSAAIARLKGALLTLAQPLLTVIIPVFTALVNLLTAVVGKIASFLSMLGGKSAQESAKAAKALNNQGKAYENVGKAAKEASKQLMGFDELNTLQDTSTDTASGGGGVGATEGIAPDFSWSEGLTETMEKLASWVMVIAAGFALWKIGTMLTGPLATILTTVGKLIAGIGLVAVGLILLTSGFKDAFENGMTLENTLMIIAGIIATGLGITLLTGSLIPLLVAGILGLLVAIANLTGNGGEMIDGLKQIFSGLSDFITGVFTGDWEKAWDGIVQAGRGAVNVLISIINSLIDLAVAGLNLIQIDIPAWVPMIGGRHFGINIQNPPHIPYLAQGAVIPPNREFLAVLGDQTNGNNIEAPENLIRKIVREESGGSGRLEELLEILIATVEGIEVGDEVIGKAAARYTRNTSRARGT